MAGGGRIAPQDDVALVAQGLYPIGGSPEDLTARMKSDYEKWGSLIRKLNLKPQ